MVHYRGTTRLCACCAHFARLQQAPARITAANPWRPTEESPLWAAPLRRQPPSRRPPARTNRRFSVSVRETALRLLRIYKTRLCGIVARPAGACQGYFLQNCRVFHSFNKVIHKICALFLGFIRSGEILPRRTLRTRPPAPAACPPRRAYSHGPWTKNVKKSPAAAFFSLTGGGWSEYY